MVLLIRFILVAIIIYLIVKSFVRFFEEEKRSSQNRHENNYTGNSGSKGVAKDVGEYIDYEEVD